MNELGMVEQDMMERDMERIATGGVDNSTAPAATVAEANRILENGNPIEYILDVFNQIHIGDRQTGEVLALSIASACIRNCAGLHPKLSGESGKGKSHSCKTMIHLMPKGHAINTSLSAKALFYTEDMKDGMVIFSDDIELSPDLESILKRSTSEFQQGIEHRTIDAARHAQLLKMIKRPIWWLASVESEFDMQTLNRQVGINIDNSPETDRKVMEQQIRMAGTGEEEYPETFEAAVCREIIEDIKNLFVRVVIPFNDRIEWGGVENRRNLPIFLDMVKCYAVYNHRQRKSNVGDDGVEEIVATTDDYYAAEAVYLPRAEAQTNKLNENEVKIIDYLGDVGVATISTISVKVKLPYQTVSRLLQGRSDSRTSGLLGKVKGLTKADCTKGERGDTVRALEFALHDYNRLDSYGRIVTLRGEKNMGGTCHDGSPKPQPQPKHDVSPTPTSPTPSETNVPVTPPSSSPSESDRFDDITADRIKAAIVNLGEKSNGSECGCGIDAIAMEANGINEATVFEYLTVFIEKLHAIKVNDHFYRIVE